MENSKPASDQIGLAYQLVPWEAVRRVSRVCLEGQQKYPGRAINARNLVPAVNDVEWQTERLNHAMDHLAKWMNGDRTEDHLAKVMWFCAVMIELERVQAQSGTFEPTVARSATVQTGPAPTGCDDTTG